MFKKVMAALLATVAFMPAAHAQEGDRRGDRGAGMSGRGDMQRMRERGGDGQRAERQRPDVQRPDVQRPERQPDQPRAAPPVQAQAQAQVERPSRNQGYDAGAGRGNMFAERAQRRQAEAQGQTQVQTQFPRQRDGDRVNRSGDWRRDDARRDAPAVIDQRRADAVRGDGDRRIEDRRRLDDGRRNGVQRWTGNRAGNDDRNRNDRNWGNDRRSSNNWSVGNWSNNGRSDWNRRWRDDNRYDWGRYRQQNRNLFRLPRYYAPADWNYGYRRFSIGVTLSSLLWNQDYWIDEPDYYRLPPAYGPYRWVRYYNDALLVDVRSGYVVDTVYDIFW